MTESSLADSSTDSAALSYAPIHRCAMQIASGALHPRAWVEACLARIEAGDEKLHAFTSVYREDALDAADASAKLIRAGHRLGPLHGVPVAIKDLCDIEGRVTTAGSQAWAERVSDTTATVIERLRAAGAIVLGKTHMVEFALGAWGTNQHMGTPWNPWHPTVHHTPGGSSSGSAVAVAAGLAPAALGSDTGGSVRIPSSFCGLVGLKTTAGRVSNHGVVPLSTTLDTVGPMTRSVEDAALLFAVLNGPDPRDPTTLAVPHLDPMPALKRGIAGMRLGVLALEDLGSREYPVAEDVAEHYRAAADALAELGAELIPVALGDFSFLNLQRQTGIVIAAEGYQILREHLEREDLPFDTNVHRRLMVGKDIAAADYIGALREMQQLRREMAAFMGDYDALLAPTSPHPALPVAEVDESDVPSASRFTRAGNFLGLCALAIPMGLTTGGLPTSLQIIGKPYAEDTVLRIGWAFEQARPFWQGRRLTLP